MPYEPLGGGSGGKSEAGRGTVPASSIQNPNVIAIVVLFIGTIVSRWAVWKRLNPRTGRFRTGDSGRTNRRNYPPHTSDLSGDSGGIQDSPPFPSLSWPAPLTGIVGQFTGFHFSTWPRISPPGCSLVCTLKYHLPASRSFAWSAVRVAVPLIGLTMGVSLIGTCGPPFSPGIAGP